jgi:hypothetical protein
LLLLLDKRVSPAALSEKAEEERGFTGSEKGEREEAILPLAAAALADSRRRRGLFFFAEDGCAYLLVRSSQPAAPRDEEALLPRWRAKDASRESKRSE